ncbi:hypothetical protein DYB38_001726 [Aphanomyces astaci]|uniref:Uncharacterized protein n=1 Tax=Aphanomyces astaci TaxID=112090 RepID=A0A397CU28_APHAT|nr:hypothetical protein DYB38_001726 [Aphanomyces astaci]
MNCNAVMLIAGTPAFITTVPTSTNAKYATATANAVLKSASGHDAVADNLYPPEGSMNDKMLSPTGVAHACEMEEHDDVSIGSTMSDEEEDNQLSACTSPTKSTEQHPHNELRHSSASGSLPSINDRYHPRFLTTTYLCDDHRFADPLPSDPRAAAVDSMIDQMKLKMDELSELKATIMHTFVHACGRIDAFVRSTTGQPPRLHHVEVMPDIQHMDQVVTRWERSLADWNMRVREDLAHECRREVLGMQHARLQEAIHQVHMQEEIAAHVQSTQEHNMREVEALNYKLLNTLVDQDRQLQLKEAAMLERIQAIDADRAQLRCEHLAFEQQKKAILSDLKNVCDYFSTYESSHPSSSAKVI